jgi:Domain of unknown function (DUF892)
VEHYEISRYGTLRTWARELGLSEAVRCEVRVAGNPQSPYPSERAGKSYVFHGRRRVLGDPPIRGALPGTAAFKERVQNSVVAIERNWLIKSIAIVAGLAAAAVSFVQLFRLLRN